MPCFGVEHMVGHTHVNVSRLEHLAGIVQLRR